MTGEPIAKAGGLASESAAKARSMTDRSAPIRYALGIDVGASSVKLAAVRCAPPGQAGAARLVWTAREPHFGDASATLLGLLARLRDALGSRACEAIVATGSGAAALRDACVAVSVLEDVPAITRGAVLLAPTARSVMEIGGQNGYFVAIESGRAPEFAMNESCASGTGSFFEDQMSRLGMRIEDYSSVVSGARSVPRLSGRCAVFAKTDIIHRQQEGAPVEDILLGLCYAMVRSYKATVVRGLPVRPPVVLSGGAALNAGVVRAVREVFGLAEGELLASDELLFLQAAGAALEAAEGRRGAAGAACDAAGAALEAVDAATASAREASGSPLERLMSALARDRGATALPTLAPLPRVPLERGCGYDLVPESERELDASGLVPVTLGIDVGSTSTDLVLLDGQGRIVEALYLRTGGDAAAAVRAGLAQLGERLGPAVRVVAVATTGSGRERMGRLVGADLVRDEITAQAAAAAKADPQADTVFEIGGQDSKFISLRAGQVTDFQMNKICAAGTGSFVEEQAARMGIAIDDFGRIALESTAPLDLGERCTVFVESAITEALAEGADKRDVAAGLCLSVVHNYLHRVVGTKHVGERIVLQGGVAYNPGIVAAFRASFGERLTVSPWFAVSGAAGAALLAAEAASDPGFSGTTFRGWDLMGAGERPSGTVAPGRVAPSSIEANRAFFRKSADLFLADYTPERDPAKPTVGIPRALLLHRLFPMANAFFRELGFNTYLTPETSEDTIRAAQATCQGEVCYPVKLVHGHMAELAEAQVDYVFMPRVRTMRHEGSRVRHNYACVYMQTAPALAARALRFEERGIRLLSPVLDMDFGQAEMATAMLGVGAELGFSPERTAQAMLAGGFALTEYGERVERLGDELLASLGPCERVLVIVTRNYGIADPVLNMGIPELLLERGARVITMGHLRGHDVDVSADYPDMCWPFGQHILGSARIIREDPRLFAVYLTNHGCGPDTMLSHLFAEEMGTKPYLQIEVDEHFSKVGVITRVEAFLNALDHWDGAVEDVVPAPMSAVGAPTSAASAGASRPVATGSALLAGTAAAHPVGAAAAPPAVAAARLTLGCKLGTGRPVALPDLGPHARAIALWLGRRGHDATLVPADRVALDAGKSEAVTKEYLTFTMLLGQAIVASERAFTAQVVLPRTDGAEADGQYARVIAGILARRGTAARVVAPKLETLAWECPDVEGLFDAVLEGDEELAHGTRAPAGQAAPAGDSLRAHVTQRSQAPAGTAKTLGVVGEWELVAADALTDGLLARIEREGVRLARMPLAEYLWFLWNDDLASERLSSERQEGGALAPSELERREALLARLAERMRTLAVRLQERSPFSDDLVGLVASADEGIGRFAGAGGRYRLAKARELGRRCDGVVTVSSMYENTDTILQLLRDREGAPVLSLAFDGSPGQGAEERLRSFLYYL